MANVVDEELCSVYSQLSESESVKNTNMWVGSHTTEPHETHILNDENNFVKCELLYPDSMFQIFMEQVANMLDIRNENPDTVNMFRYEFADGQVSVFNNGASIPVAMVRDKSGKDIWIPEMLCSKFLSSSNHDKSSAKKRISLGTHGIGIKAMTSLSKMMRIECVDTSRNKYYCQEILNCNKVVNPPIIQPVKKAPKEIREGGTRFTYILDYNFYKNKPTDIFDTLDKLFVSRIYQILGYSDVLARSYKTKLSCFYNGKRLNLKSVKELAQMYFGTNVICFDVDSLEFPLSIGIASAKGNSERISIINGGFISKGTHFKYLEDMIISFSKEKIEKFLKDKVKWRRQLVANNLSILIVGAIPDLEFADQVKSNLKMKKSYFENFSIPKSVETKLWKILKEQLTIEHFVKTENTKTDTRRKLQNRDKYEPARKLRTPKSDLMVFEGDSAKSSAKIAMADSKIPFSAEYHGIFLLGGCPINVLNHIKQKTIGGKSYETKNDKINANIVWNDFMTVMNLKYELSYEDDKDFKSLNYQMLTMIVDKDDHGMGKIAPIFMSNICKFWPLLLKRQGFFAYMDTPIIRALPTNKKIKVMEFMTNHEFNNWKQATFGSEDVKGWEIKYYKGMATHSKFQCSHMFAKYDKLRISFTSKQISDALLLFEEYFGKDSIPRKRLLVSPPLEIPIIENRATLSVCDHLNSYTKTEQQYNLLCKLNSWMDGFIFSHRKIGDALIDYVCGKNDDIKVFQFGGECAKSKGYHHGDASLNGSIIWLGQDFVGARNIPFVMPLSSFGTRFDADDSGAPRYLDMKANPLLLLLFPVDDRKLLTMREEDGKTLTPLHMMPILPLAIMETSHLPATGWAINRTARHPQDILSNIKRMIAGKLPKPMRAWLPNWRGRIIDIDGHEWCVGSCSYNNKTNTVVIYELPYGVKNKSYIYGSKNARKKDQNGNDSGTGLFALSLVNHNTIIDTSSELEIKISFKLVDGAIEQINEKYGNEHFSPLEDYLMLKDSMRHNLNYVNDDGSVREFATYEGVFAAWFKERYSLYVKRFAYQRELMNWMLFMLREKLRFIIINEKLNLEKKRRAEQVTILKANKFRRINTRRLQLPTCLEPSQIRDMVFGDGATYTYLHLTYDDMCDEAVEILKKKIEDIQRKIADLNEPGILCRTWINECEKAIDVIDDAHKNGWVKNEHKY